MNCRTAVRQRLFVAAMFVFSATAFGQEPAPSAETEWQAVAQHISRAIATGTNEEKRDALFAIRNYRSERASELAIPALSDPDEIVRATAAAALVFMEPSLASKLLIFLLVDKQPFVRKEAAYALEHVASPDSIIALATAFRRDRDREVRSAAAIALGAIRSETAVVPLTEFLRTRPRDDDEFIRRSAARSIGRIAEKIRFGRASETTPQNFLPEKLKETPPEIILEIETHPAFNAADSTLRAVLANPKEAPDTRREAAFAIGAIGKPSSLAILQRYLGNPDPYLSEIAREALLKNRTVDPLK
ncbi:hypothetical protein BH24ACI3_BH24ACI3_16350 [soil metagenome]